MINIPLYEETGFVPYIFAEIGWTGGSAEIPWSRFLPSGHSLSCGNLSDGFLIGQVITQVLTLRLDNSDHFFDGKLLQSVRFYMQYDGHNDEYYEFGDFYVDSVDDTYRDTITITAKDPTGHVDKMFDNSADAAYQAGSSADIDEVYADILNTCALDNVSGHMPSYYNAAVGYITIPEGEISCRQMLEYILQAIGRNMAYAGHAGNVSIVGYKDKPLTTYATIDKQHTLSYARSGKTITGIQFSYIEKAGSTRSNKVVFSGSSRGKVLQQNSPFVTVEMAAAGALTGTSNLQVRKFAAELPFNPCLEVMDRVKVIDWEGNEFFSYITGVTHNFNGKTEIQCSI